MPPPEGMASRPNTQTSWMFRRNYTFSVIDNSAQASQWWDTTGHTFASAGNRGPGTPDSIICALNNFGQDDLFQVAGGKYNGYCLRSDRFTDRNGWPNIFHAGRCKITFGSTSTKKKRAGADAWEVLSELLLQSLPYPLNPFWGNNPNLPTQHT
jgi:hypothetical protein